MKKIFSSNNIYFSSSKNPKASRGVFARTNIKIGETVERCPIIEIPEHELENLANSVLTNYIYFFGKKKERLSLALGFGSLYNHSYIPNAMYKINSREKTIEFISVKKINKDEEITVNYLQRSRTKLPLWFDV